MQPKYTHNKSNIIKITEDAKRKSRQRLIGSIVLLFFALVILLNVTAKVKPIAINPEVVEIKNASATNESETLTLKNNASGPIMVSQNPARQTALESTPSSQTESSLLAIESSAGAAKPTGFKAEVSNRDSAATRELPLQGTIKQPQQQNQSVDLSNAPAEKPKARAVKVQAVNPADILDGIENRQNSAQDQAEANTTAPKKSFLQFAALSSQEKAAQLQQVLAGHGIKASVQPIKTANGTLYRLRAGPFTRSEAQQKLAQMNDAGYGGIVTGN